ncbi:hypothetical protein [Dysgonomonas sp. 25]|uniref:hypothetical protein n=1 Tax=Dysgonomonas sp. 25 TaxID=2302933 RepID=UPI0013D45272|nr:hypothetical protein [Dysgonomonas sp. 25]NDV67854.1 hypothetical protein [Dysgonomonas sp. 25]
MKKIAILIRVYDRIEDLKYNLRIIADTWKSNDYYVIVVSNGKSNGYIIPEECKPLIDKLIVLEENAGHRKGNSQLLLEGIQHIPEESDYTLILEADTWLYGDAVISKYTNLLAQSVDIVWASADWLDKWHALGTDYAIIESGYLRKNPQLFNFEIFPEFHIANYLRDTQVGYLYITENMPVHVPSYVRKYPYIPNKEGRFYIFPKSRMVTHHVEWLKGGMEQKKRYFNIVADTDYFPEVKVSNKAWKRFRINFWMNLTKCFVKRTWFKAKVYKETED